VAWQLERTVLKAERWLAGREVKIVDGTSFSMPDTAANQALWPQPSGQRPGCGFPVAKMVGLFSLASGALLEQSVGNLHVHDSLLFTSLWDRLSRGDIVLGDRAFCSYGAMAALFQRGVDTVIRLHQLRKTDWRRGQHLGPGDRLVTWTRPGPAPEHWTQAQWDLLPAQLSVRLVRVIVETPGFRTRSVFIATTLTDATLYPADALRELYAQGWQIECFRGNPAQTGRTHRPHARTPRRRSPATPPRSIRTPRQKTKTQQLPTLHRTKTRNEGHSSPRKISRPPS
jgi:hypothetical protein